ncbi:MAG: aminopeptidase P family protein [bacterium]|nr:aminopeptidase P family protein [bacterium]
MNFDYAARQARLQAIQGAKAIALVPGANMVYFTGLHFHLSERPTIALWSDGQLSFIIPELEVPKLRERPDIEARVFAWKDSNGYAAAFAEAARELNLSDGALGVDGQAMRVFESQAFEAAGVTKVANIGQELLKIRAIKTQQEVDAMREAIRISEAALATLMTWIQPGMSEREIGAQLSRLMMEHGSQGVTFEPLIQSGPNSANPHGFITDRQVQADEFLLIDFGGRWQEYPADITRTVCLGVPTAEMQTIYDTVLAANQAALAVAKPGVTCGEVDQAARAVIEAAGYGQYFIHRTGHGLGLEGHELPQIAGGVQEPLQTGMVFTIEPGIYVPGLGGVRIEDNIVVTESGAESLTQFPRQLTTR